MWKIFLEAVLTWFSDLLARDNKKKNHRCAAWFPAWETGKVMMALNNIKPTSKSGSEIIVEVH